MSETNPQAAAAQLRLIYYLPEVLLSHGGVTRAVLDWCAVMHSRGHRVTLVYLDGTDIPQEWRTGSTEYPKTVLARISRRWGALVTLDDSQIDQLVADADVVHLHAPWLVGNAQFARSAKAQNKPYVVTAHGMLDDWSMSQRGFKKRLYMLLKGRKLLDSAACIHLTAGAELSQAKKWFNHTRTSVLPYLFDLRPFKHLPGPALAQEKFPHLKLPGDKVLFLSRLHEKKGPDVFLKAFALVRKNRPGSRAYMVGTGESAYEQMLRELVRELGLNDCVDFLGLVTGELKISLYEACDVFVLPTQQENFGLVLVESFASGTPVVTTDAVDIWQEIQQGGAQIAERTPQAMADAMMKVLSLPGGPKVLGQMGRNWTFANLEMDLLAEQYEKLYMTLAGKSSGAGAVVQV